MRPSLRNESNDADVADQKLCCRDRLSYLTGVVGAEGVAAIEPIYSKQAVADGTTLTLGGTGIEPSHAGAAHAPGDILAQLPKQQTILVWALLYSRSECSRDRHGSQAPILARNPVPPEAGA